MLESKIKVCSIYDYVLIVWMMFAFCILQAVLNKYHILCTVCAQCQILDDAARFVLIDF